MSTTHQTEGAPVATTADRFESVPAGPRWGSSKKDAPTEAQFGALQKMFDYFNAELFDGKLGHVMLNLSRHNPRTLGFFAPDRWEGEGSDKRVSEISLNPSNLRYRTPEQICSTMVHEQCHFLLWERKMASRGGYHCRRFSDLMQSVGLITSSTGAPGGARTGQKISHYIEPTGAFARAFERMPKDWFLPFTCGERSDKRPTGKGDASKTRYQCPTCRTRFWGKPGIEAICTPCLVIAKETGAPIETAVYLEAA